MEITLHIMLHLLQHHHLIYLDIKNFHHLWWHLESFKFHFRKYSWWKNLYQLFQCFFVQKFLYCLTFSKFFKKQLFPLQELFILFYLWCHPYLSINHTYNLFQIHFVPLQSNWHLFYYVNYSLQYVDQHFQ